MEKWKTIKEFENYQISDNGKVKRVGKYNNQFTEWECEKILKPTKNEKGYLYVNLCKNKKIYHKYIHRLVADAYIDNPENKLCVNHIDGNKENCCVSNLEWNTYAENNIHAYRVLGKTNKNNKISKPVLQYDLQGKFIKEYPSYREAKRQTGIFAIDKVCKGQQGRKQAGGYVWKYKEEQ